MGETELVDGIEISIAGFVVETGVGGCVSSLVQATSNTDVFQSQVAFAVEKLDEDSV